MTEPVERPTVSVVTPSYNQARFLRATIESVLASAGRGSEFDLEYIVVDGGSTDESAAIIAEYDADLAWWVSEPDGGHYSAVNKGFAGSSGEIMYWINADDLLCPWALRTVIGVFRDLPTAEWITTLCPLTWTADGTVPSRVPFGGISAGSLLGGSHLPGGRPFLGWVQQESTFWRRSLWRDAGASLNEELALAADFDLWVRFARRAEPVAVDTPLGGFRFNSGQRSERIEEYVREARSSLAANVASDGGGARGVRPRGSVRRIRGRTAAVADPRSGPVRWVERERRFRGHPFLSALSSLPSLLLPSCKRLGGT